MNRLEIARTLKPVVLVNAWSVPIILGLGVLSSLAEGVGIGLFIPFLHTLADTAQPEGIGIGFADSLGRLFGSVPPDRRLQVIAICIFGSVVIKATLSYGSQILFERLDSRTGHRLRRRIFQQMLTINYGFIERTRPGHLINLLTTQTWRTGEALRVAAELFIISSTILVYTTILLLISWRMMFLVGIGIVLIALVVRLVTRQARALGEQVTKSNSELADRMVEGIHGMKVIRAFGREPYEQTRFDQVSQLLSGVLFRLGIVKGAVTPIYEILAVSLLVAILLTTLQNPANLPSVLVFMFLLYRLQPKVRDLDAARIRLNSLLSAVQEVTTMIDREDKAYQPSGRLPYEALQREIVFDRVSFRYNDEDGPVLCDVSISIPKGKTTALVGPSGGGKSTLIKLILRFHEVTEGEIHIDDRPLSELDLASWRRRVALVSQDVYIFNATVRENILYGRLEATEEEVIDAARRAAAHEFICQLPDRYDTVLGPRGARLSGGQQQRVTLARAIIRDPEILILDEATNALDSISERLVQEALDTFGRGRTVIMIAHRLSTIERADQILVLADGRVREQGEIEQLLKHEDGLFAKLYSLQYQRAHT